MVFTPEFFLFVIAFTILRFTFLVNYWKSVLGWGSLFVITYFSWQSAVLVFTLSLLTYLVLLLKKQLFNRLLIGFLVVFLLCLKHPFFQDFSILGFAYYALQLISILIYSNQKQSFIEVLTGSAFFARFFSGPIIDKNSLLIHNKTSKEDIYYGINRIALGILKKVILTSRLAAMTAGYFDQPLHAQNQLIALSATLLFTFQMYLDFSAYTDIAIGSGRLLGVKLPENFNLSLRSKSISEYWRKTHITLIKWLTQYVFYPINFVVREKQKIAVVIAILVTFILSGVWHGLHIGFIIWGAINGFYLVLEFKFPKLVRQFTKLPVLPIIMVISLVSLSNYFFKISDYSLLKPAILHLLSVPFFPQDYLSDFIGILGNGGYLEQQFHLVETLLLVIIFFTFERFIEQKAKSEKFSYTYLIACILLIFVFGSFSGNQEFIYLQF